MHQLRSRRSDPARWGFDLAPQSSPARVTDIVAVLLNSGRRHVPAGLPSIDTAVSHPFGVDAEIRPGSNPGTASAAIFPPGHSVAARDVHDSLRNPNTRFTRVTTLAFRGIRHSDASLFTRRCRAQADDATFSS